MPLECFDTGTSTTSENVISHTQKKILMPTFLQYKHVFSKPTVPFHLIIKYSNHRPISPSSPALLVIQPFNDTWTLAKTLTFSSSFLLVTIKLWLI